MHPRSKEPWDWPWPHRDQEVQGLMWSRELPACTLWPPDFFSSAQRRGLERVHSKSSDDLPLPHLLWKRVRMGQKRGDSSFQLVVNLQLLDAINAILFSLSICWSFFKKVESPVTFVVPIYRACMKRL